MNCPEVRAIMTKKVKEIKERYVTFYSDSVFSLNYCYIGICDSIYDDGDDDYTTFV